MPSSTVRAVRSPSTVRAKSVPRIAAAAAGVSTVRPRPPRVARPQSVPRCNSKTLSAAVPICLTTSVVFRASRICVRSANSTASWPAALVRSTSPPSRFCASSTAFQPARSMNCTSSPDLRAMTEPAAGALRGKGSAAAVPDNTHITVADQMDRKRMAGTAADKDRIFLLSAGLGTCVKLPVRPEGFCCRPVGGHASPAGTPIDFSRSAGEIRSSA